MNKYIISILLLVSFLFSSCNKENEGMSISLSIASSKLDDASESSADDESQSPYIPQAMIEYLTDNKGENSKIDIGVKAPGKNLKVSSILSNNFEFNITKKEKEVVKGFSYGFETSLEEGKNRVLLFKLGDKNFKNSTKDFNSESLFLNGGLYDIKDGLVIENLKLLPVFNFSGNFLAYGEGDRESGNSPNTLTEKVEVKIYPSILKENGSFTNSLEKTFDEAGSFDISYVYSLFKKADKMPESFSNVLVVAKQNDKVGFTLVSKEFLDLKSYATLATTNVDLKHAYGDEYECYKDFNPKSVCENVELNCEFGTSDFSDVTKLTKYNNCTLTQSGNLVPGIKLHNDIILYKENYIKKLYNFVGAYLGKPLVSSVSTPKLAKNITVFNDLYGDADPDRTDDALVYYGNFFITGFNFNQIKFNEEMLNPENPEKDIKAGVTRIYYTLPDSLEGKLGDIQTMFIEYRGPYHLYRVQDNLNGLAGLDKWVMQNRLPFFKVYLESNIPKAEPFNFAYKGNIKILLNDNNMFSLNDGGDDRTQFIGIKKPEKLITSLKGANLIKITFSPDTENFITIYPDHLNEEYPNE